MKRIVALTGAGISAESGIETYRAADGLWANHNIEDICTPHGFKRNPTLVYKFYNDRRRQLREVSPNPAHHALATLAAHSELTLVTQNVDDLHERAGSMTIHIHGELKATRCTSCNRVSPYLEDFDHTTPCPLCAQKSLRPHIVFFGETPFFMDLVYQALNRCDLFISIGTSGVVYPAAGFVEIARLSGAYCIECNLESTVQKSNFDEEIIGPAATTLPQWVDEFIKSK